MPNPNPVQTDEFKRQQLPKYGDRALSKKVVGTRYPEPVFAELQKMTSEECQSFIRAAVEEKMKSEGLLTDED